MMDAFHSAPAPVRLLSPARQKCFLSSLLHTVSPPKKAITSLSLDQEGAANRKSLGFPGADYTLSSR